MPKVHPNSVMRTAELSELVLYASQIIDDAANGGIRTRQDREDSQRALQYFLLEIADRDEPMARSLAELADRIPDLFVVI